MKTLLNLLRLSPLLLLVGCSTTSALEKRISKHPELMAQLSEDHQLLVRQGRVTEGMDRNAVFLSWGPADSVAQGSKNGKSVETWLYGGGYTDYNAPRFNIGYGYGGYGSGGGHFGYGVNFPIGGPDTHYHGDSTARVVFSGGKVTEWQSAMR
ncbi:MAG: hypothetical protein AAGH89_11510 [Verrucomicrobiota bacterium]